MPLPPRLQFRRTGVEPTLGVGGPAISQIMMGIRPAAETAEIEVALGGGEAPCGFVGREKEVLHPHQVHQPIDRLAEVLHGGLREAHASVHLAGGNARLQKVLETLPLLLQGPWVTVELGIEFISGSVQGPRSNSWPVT